MKSKSGFTIVELLVVIVVISILASIGFVSYAKIKSSADDSKRDADVTLLRHELETYYEKNGEYPLGCYTYNICEFQLSDYATFGLGVPPPQVNLTTTLPQLQAILPGIPNDFGDPKYHKSTPMTQGNNGGYIFSGGYFYTSNGILQQASATSAFYNTPELVGSSTNVLCGWTRQKPSPQRAIPDTYVVGYYSESKAKWLFWQGTHKDGDYSIWNPGGSADCILQN